MSQDDPDIFELSAGASRDLALAGDEFLVAVLTQEVHNHPGNLAALSDLGHSLTRLGKHAEGLQVDQQLARLAPEDPIAHYNLACSLTLMSRPEEALEELERAFRLGYVDTEHLLGDADLTALRALPPFQDLVRRMTARVRPG